MGVAEVRRLLHTAGVEVKAEGRLPNDKGTRLDCVGGEVILVYDTGRVVVQGSNQDRIREILQLDRVPPERPGSIPVAAPPDPRQKVFVVYGHDRGARDELELILRRWNLEPLILDLLPSGGDTIIEKLERYTGLGTHFAVVLATGDDLGCQRSLPEELRPRARQNVVLELGMLLAKLGRKKVVILLKDEPNMEAPSDISGLMYIPFRSTIAEVRDRLAQEMREAGIRLPH